MGLEPSRGSCAPQVPVGGWIGYVRTVQPTWCVCVFPTHRPSCGSDTEQDRTKPSVLLVQVLCFLGVLVSTGTELGFFSEVGTGLHFGFVLTRVLKMFLFSTYT